MKVSGKHLEERRSRLMELLRQSGGYDPEKLAAQLGCSVSTVRRDLVFLAGVGLVSKRYGSAHVEEERAGAVADARAQARRQIAQLAASLVEDGDVLFLNTSQTALDVLRYITARGVTVITNNANAVAEHCPEGVSVILTGGELRHPKASMVGDYAVRNLMGMSATKSFIGCSGLSLEGGMTTANANEVTLNRLMLERVTKKAFILADHTKLGKTSFFQTCAIEGISNVITDGAAPAKAVAELEQRGITVLRP